MNKQNFELLNKISQKEEVQYQFKIKFNKN